MLIETCRGFGWLFVSLRQQESEENRERETNTTQEEGEKKQNGSGREVAGRSGGSTASISMIT